jgi:hypothetical protein
MSEELVYRVVPVLFICLFALSELQHLMQISSVLLKMKNLLEVFIQA